MEAILILALLALSYQILVRMLPAAEKKENDRKKEEVKTSNIHKKSGDEFAAGSGRPEDPYLIASAEQLNSVRFYLDCHFKQIESLNLKNQLRLQEWRPIGDESAEFTGSYDGASHPIFGLNLENEKGRYCGLFGYTGKTAVLKNIYLQESSFYGDLFLAGLVGWNNGRIERCYAAGRITGFKNIGSLAGSNDGTIEECLGAGRVYGASNCGGLVGWNGGRIRNCHANTRVSGNKALGGLTGCNYGLIEKCFSAGDVYGEKRAGSLVGWNTGSIKKSYARRGAAPIREFEREAGILKTERRLKQQKTFTSWDFAETWNIKEGKSYPYLGF